MTSISTVEGLRRFLLSLQENVEVRALAHQLVGEGAVIGEQSGPFQDLAGTPNPRQAREQAAIGHLRGTSFACSWMPSLGVSSHDLGRLQQCWRLFY
ncbi:hypothetical protein [Methylocapsa palsarum]|uniref:Uncharacterized protein n=1 Tax=Methylocapsa palsarum TaxID=1612308 RepID=A0A1I4CGA6_9HYPH|nr:hypothetical protein [Methylocapsa palsarum]SFK79011.1 hypothetical protein SAMN05444581_12110 [Methylocapsa palsarum]